MIDRVVVYGNRYKLSISCLVFQDCEGKGLLRCLGLKSVLR